MAMKETELAQKFIEYLSCYDLFFEVSSLSGCVDIVAFNPPILIAYEVKLSVNFEVIEQAYRNTNNFHYSYVCAPWPSRGLGFQRELCQMLGIGVLLWREHDRVTEYLRPRFNRKAWTSKVRLHEYNKRSIAGAASDGSRMTPFKITVENMVRYVKHHPGCSLKDMFKNISHHYHSDTGAISSTYQWLRRGVITAVRLEKGKLYLNEETINNNTSL